MLSRLGQAVPEVLSSWEDLADDPDACADPHNSEGISCHREEEVELGAPSLGHFERPEVGQEKKQLDIAANVDVGVSLCYRDIPAEANETKDLLQLNANIPSPPNPPHAILGLEDQDGLKEDVEKGRPNLLYLDVDTLCRCFELLSLKEVCTLAQCCKRLREVAYNDLVWQAQFRKVWPDLVASVPHSGRDSFFQRWKACRQLRFSDPVVNLWESEVVAPHSSILQVLVNSDQTITVLTRRFLSVWSPGVEGVRGRLFEHERASRTNELSPLVPIELPMLRLKWGLGKSSDIWAEPEPRLPDTGEGNEAPGCSKGASKNIEVKAARLLHPNLKEHFYLIAEGGSIYLYSNLLGLRGLHCRGLSGAPLGTVQAITNTVLDLPCGAPEAVIASGAIDKVVKLWTLGMRRNGARRLLCSLRGHEDAVAFLCVARHDSSLLVSVGTSGIVKLWDAAAALELRGATAGTAKSCLATWKVAGPTAGAALCGDTCYVAGETVVTAINLASLQVLGPVATHTSRISAMALNAAGDRLCTGLLNGSVHLWDPSRCDFKAPKALAELAGHRGPVAKILIDAFKIVTRSDNEESVLVSDAETGSHIHCFPSDDKRLPVERGVLQMAMRGPLLVLAKSDRSDLEFISADFRNSICPLTKNEGEDELEGQEELGRFWKRPSESADEEIAL